MQINSRIRETEKNMDMDTKENNLYVQEAGEQKNMGDMQKNADPASGDLFTVLNEAEEKQNESAPAEESDSLVKTLPGTDENPAQEETDNASFLQARLLPGTTMEEIHHVQEEENNVKQWETPSASTPAKKSERKISLRNLKGHTAGQMLAAARNENAMSIEDVAAATLIRADYITALEDDNTKNLPPVIFVKAYIRALSKLYNLDENSVEMLKELLADLEPAADVPEKVVDELNKNVQINEEEARKVRITGYYILGTLAVLLILIVSLTVYLIAVKGKNVQQKVPQSTTSSTKVSAGGAKNTVFDASGITVLIPQIIPEEKILPLPAKRSRSASK